MDRLKRLGLMTELTGQLEAVERRLKGIHGSITDAIFPLKSYLDTDAQSVAQFGNEYLECWQEGQALRNRIEELKQA